MDLQVRGLTQFGMLIIGNCGVYMLLHLDLYKLSEAKNDFILTPSSTSSSRRKTCRKNDTTQKRLDGNLSPTKYKGKF
jgi:hypothetical protein